MHILVLVRMIASASMHEDSIEAFCLPQACHFDELTTSKAICLSFFHLVIRSKVKRVVVKKGSPCKMGQASQAVGQLRSECFEVELNPGNSKQRIQTRVDAGLIRSGRE